MANWMLYRKHQEYHQPPRERDLEILRRWLNGETGTESLRTWLSSLYGQ